MANQLFATKSVDDLHADDSSGPKLRRVLSATALTALGIGGIIGTGIFVLTGVAAAENAGPALALAFIVAGTPKVYGALVEALAPHLPEELRET